MKSHFIFQYKDNISGESQQIITVIFISQSHIDQNELAQEINEFFREHSFSDKLVILLPSYCTPETNDMFHSSRDRTFERLPGRSDNYYDEAMLIFVYESDGSLTQAFGQKVQRQNTFLKHLMRNGSAKIFKDNGGMVESTPDHHFVFPSKKHCSKFIRTGNVLINSNEIFFLALQLLPYFKGKNKIYCDTSSINVLPYVVFEMLRRFNVDYNCPIVNSFKSYEIFEANKKRFSDDTLILVSSSTSGNIIERLLEHKLAEKNQIKVLYFLGEARQYNLHADNIICNLTYDSNIFNEGIKAFETYNSEHDCNLCKNHSRPIYIRSDVFLTIQPKVERVLIGVPQAPKNLSLLLKRYRGGADGDVIFKTYYKENDANADYEIFVDTMKLFSKIGTTFKPFQKKLEKLINKYIPANVSCLIHLPDNGSEELAKLIKSKINTLIDVPLIKLEKGFENQIKDTDKCAVIVASSIIMGKDFLHVSRSLRKYEDLSIIYFVGILRTINEEYSNTLKSNLGKGKDDSDERPLYAVEKFFCSAVKRKSAWFQEKVFLENIIGEIEEESFLYTFVDERINLLRDNKIQIGLSENVFLKSYKNENLILRKNFAFFNFPYNDKEIFQSEVYFVISSIISHLENFGIDDKFSLKQSNYIRNVLCPGNFQRYNDGIIQACLLRSGKPEFFAYDLQDDLSLEMKTFLLSLIEQYDTEHGEALLEFLLAIGIRKLTLKKNDLKEVLENAIRCPEKLISDFAIEISKVIFSDAGLSVAPEKELEV